MKQRTLAAQSGFERYTKKTRRAAGRWRELKQRTLAAQSGFERYTKKTRRAEFLEEMEQVVPWAELCALIEPVYPKAGQERPPVGVERMLRIYFVQQWFNLSDPAVEEALYESVSLRGFVDIDLGLSVGAARLTALATAAASSGAAALAASDVANSGEVIVVAPGEGAAAGQWVVVTQEQTTGRGAYAGLPPGPHVTPARVHPRS